jgi:cytochrome b involved in lipid metabolism
MRPLILASALLLVLSGCAASEPQAEPSEVVSAQVQSAEPTEASAEPEPSAEVSAEPEATEAEAESTTGAQAERTEEPEATETQASETQDSEQEAEREEEAEASPSPTPTATQTQAPEPEVVGYTLAEVAQKNTSADCWVAIDGGVYDLTMWIRSHPGGSGAITQLCGKDGTSQFLSMHGGQSRPASTLDSYYIGPLR